MIFRGTHKLSIAEGKTQVYSVAGVDFATLTYSEIPTSYNDATWDAVVINYSANGYRLPTEAEWEYAAKGGQQTHNYAYSGSYTIDDVAWYNENSDSRTHEVGSKQPNELGIYDMSGNVQEWSNDRYADTFPGRYRVVRGGSWGDNATSCRVALRDSGSPGIRGSIVGFRLVLP